MFIVTILFIAFLFIPVIIQLKILKDNKNDKIVLKVKTFFGLIRYKVEIPIIDLMVKRDGMPSLFSKVEVQKPEDGETVESNKSIITIKEMERIMDEAVELTQKYSSVFQYVLDKVRCNQFLWKTELGTGDAAVTGILSGVFLMFQGIVLKFMESNFSFEDTILNFTPQFNRKTFRTTVDCIINMKIGYIIIASIKFSFLYFKKGGE